MKALLIFSILFLSACSISETTSTKAVATITAVYYDDSPMGCIGSNWNTAVATDDFYIAKLCGKLGKVGDKIAGHVDTGHMDTSLNGFHRD